MKSSFRNLIIVVLSVFLIVSFAGCGKGTGNDNAAGTEEQTEKKGQAVNNSEAEKQAKEITYVVLGGTGKEEVTQCGKDFEKETGVKVVFEDWPYSDAHTKYVTLLNAGNSPDLGYGFSSWVGEFKEREAVVKLDDLLSKDFKEDFYQNALDVCTVDGGLWAVPSYMSIRTLIIRPDLFKEKDLEPPKTFDDLLKAAKLINNPPEVYGYSLLAGHTKNTVELFLPFLWSFGGEVFSEDGSAAAFNNEDGIKALEVYTELSKYSTPGYAETDIHDMETAYASGKAAMIMHSGETPQNMKNKGNDLPFQIVPVPEGKQGVKHSLGIMDVHYIFNTDNIKESIQFLEEFQTPEYFGKVLVSHGWIPNKKALFKMEYYSSENEMVDGFAEAASYAKFKPTAVYWNQVQEALANAITKSVLGEATPKQALDEAADKVNKVIDSYK